MEENTNPIPNGTPVLRPLDSPKMVDKKTAYGALIVIFILGATTGFVLANFQPKSSGTAGTGEKKVEVVQNATQSGIKDKKTFSDTATGILREGGFEGEGSYHLERGAKDQTAYLTSTTIDLSVYIGKKVEVWGQTYASEKTGWLMDVGFAEIVK
jgi:hypothetical protein